MTQHMAPTTATRNSYLDTIAGAAIIAVVWIHASNSGVAFYNPSDISANFAYTLVIKQILVAAVPLFFVRSGYLAAKNGGPVPMHKAWQRTTRIALPYLIWSLFIVIVIQRNINPAHVAKVLILGKAVGPYYFIVSLILFNLMSPWLTRWIRSRWLLPIAFCVTLLHMLACYIAVMLNPDVNWWYLLYPPSAWVAYYVLGLYMAANPIRYAAVRFAAVIAILSLILSVGEATLFTHFLGTPDVEFTPIKISSFLYAAALAFALFQKTDRSGYGPLAALGQVSLGIFFIHEIFRGAMSQYFQFYLNSVFEIQPLFQLMVVLVTIFVCVVLIFSARYALGRKSETVLGL